MIEKKTSHMLYSIDVIKQGSKWILSKKSEKCVRSGSHEDIHICEMDDNTMAKLHERMKPNLVSFNRGELISGWGLTGV